MAIPGIDYLIPHKYTGTAARNHPDGWAAGFIYELPEYGNCHRQIQYFCRNAKPSSVRIHGMWRDDHKFPRKLWPRMVEVAKKIALLADEFPSIQFFYSPALEHRLNESEASALLLQCSQVLPARVKLVNAYISPGSAVRGVINEVHNAKPSKPKYRDQGYFTSFDGESMFNADVEAHKRTYKDAWINFAWEYRNNLRAGEKDKLPRGKRKALPDANYLKAQIRLMQPKGSAPKFTLRSNKRFDKTNIHKAYAEDGLSMGSRANKLMFVIKENVKEVVLYDSKGRAIAKAKRYGSYEGGRSRYYFSDYGWQIGVKAKRNTGSEWVVLKAGSTIYEPINPAFRTGSFQ